MVNESPVKKPPVAFRGGDDQLLKLTDFKGQLLVVNLWATWCVPCIKEMPALDRLQEKLGPRGLKVIAVNQDVKGYAAAKGFMDKTGLKNLEIFTDEKSAISSRWKVPGLPASFVMTPDGQEIARLFGAAEWDSAEMTGFLEQFLPAQENPPAGT